MNRKREWRRGREGKIGNRKTKHTNVDLEAVGSKY